MFVGSDREIQLADAINSLSKLGRVNSVNLKERRFDCGSVEGFLAASTYEYNRRNAENRRNASGGMCRHLLHTPQWVCEWTRCTRLSGYVNGPVVHASVGM